VAYFAAAIIICLAGVAACRGLRYLSAAWIPVLCYHHVADPAGDDPGGLFISPQRFNDQMGYLRKSGFSPVTLDQIHEHVSDGTALPENPVAVTFDDGYLDNWVYAYPMLRHYEIPATIFVITARVEEGDLRPTLDQVQEGALTREDLDREYGTVGEERRYLNWGELSRMRASGLVSVAGHSHRHVDLSRADKQTVLEELRQSRALLMEQAGGECLDLAWPFGYHSRSAERWARVAGCRSAYRVSTRLFGGRGNRPGANPMALRRLAVTPGLDLEQALEFYRRPSTASRLRAAVDFIGYHLRKRRSG
jgi:peptidoglycan/xylan/chitin deacetylase (PgdA/CDA1 family)